MTRSADEPAVVATNLDMAVLIFLDGVTTGVSTALANLAARIPVERRDLMTDDIVGSLTGDPLAMEQVRGEVRDRLLGLPDKGAYNFTAHGGCA